MFESLVAEITVQMAVAITDESAACLPNLQPLWHRKAPRHLHESCPADDPFAGWKAWQDHLLTRKRAALPPFLAKSKPPLLWGWPCDWDRTTVRETIASPTTLAEIFIGDDSAAVPDLPRSLQTVALAYALPTLARELPAETWWQLLERLYEAVLQVKDQHIDWPADPREVLRHQLLSGELSLALSYIFPEVRAMRALRSDARASLSDAIVNLTDGQGLPDARLLPVLGPLFACWTRVRWIGAHFARGPWPPAAELQFQWLVRHTIRLADKNGRFVLTMPDTGEAGVTQPASKTWDKKLFKMALELAGDQGDLAAAAVAMPRGAMPEGCKSAAADLPRPSLNSDWAGITIMASGWSQSDSRLAVSYVSEPMMIELSVAGERLLSGLWTFETSCNGRPVQPTGEWEQLCWEHGKRFDLLELGRSLSDGLRLERQLLFARDDRVLYLADAIISRDATRAIRHSFSLPLAHDARWHPDADTRDGLLVSRNVRTAVLPLALHEWRCDPRGGALEERAGRLVLSQETNGGALCCPLLLDLDRKRAKKQRTWRQLTVGENLDVVPRHMAVGFRAQSGRDQWLFYRSLGAPANRTVLGQNIAGEFCAGRFLPNGKLKEWIEIDPV